MSMDAVPVSETPLKVFAHEQYNAPDVLSPQVVNPDPLEQFHAWFIDARRSVREPEAMSLSTATPSGIPSSRVVLFKQLDTRGFVFYTNYTSRKSQELLANPNAALVFYWREVHRQVRVVGMVEKLSKEESDEYFHSRPVGSQIGAWASRQSSVVGEGELQRRVEELEKRFGNEVSLPDFWGGWRVIPTEIEFWAGKPSRLHDRVRYVRLDGSQEDNPKWKIERLAP